MGSAWLDPDYLFVEIAYSVAICDGSLIVVGCHAESVGKGSGDICTIGAAANGILITIVRISGCGRGGAAIDGNGAATSTNTAANACRPVGSSGSDTATVDGDVANSGIACASDARSLRTIIAAQFCAGGIERAGAAALAVDIQCVAAVDGDALRGGQRIAVGKNQVHRAIDRDAGADGDVAVNNVPSTVHRRGA